MITDLRRLASAARPVGANARRLLESLQRTDGIERLMDYIFFQMAAVNGFDSFGHYLRAGLIVNQCANYAVEPTFGCSANYPRRAGRAPRRRPPGGPARPGAAPHGDRARARARAAGSRGGRAACAARAEARRRSRSRARSRPEAAATPAPKPTPAPRAKDQQSQTETLLDYLFGGDG